MSSESPKDEIPVETIEEDAQSKNKKMPDEQYRLGGQPALKTLVKLMWGPLISQVVAAFYGLIDSMWVAKALGTKGVSAVSLFTNLDNIGRAFGFFLNCAATAKISAMIGQKRQNEAGQIVCDLFRMCFVCGAIVPALVIPISRPLAKWFGADEQTTDWGFAYLSVLMACSVFTCFFLFGCGLLQGEGRTFLVSVMQLASFILNMAVFDPLFLLGFKIGITGAAVATVLSEAIPGIVILILYFCGQFAIKPDWRGIFRKFHKETFMALRVGFSQLFANLAQSLPGILVRKYLGLITQNMGSGNFDQAMAGFNGVIRIFQVTNSFRLATSMSLLPTASYACHAGRNRRMFFLLMHASWLNLAWGLLTFTLSMTIPDQISKIISSNPDYIAWAAPMLKAANFDAIHAWVRFLCQTMLQALEYGITATIYSLFATLAANMSMSTLLYFTNKKDPIRLMYTYPLTSAVSLVVGIVIVVVPIYRAYKKGDVTTDEAKKREDEANLDNAENSDDDAEIIDSL